MWKPLACLSAAALVSGKVHFSETFDDDWEERWIRGAYYESEGKQGKWLLNAGRVSQDDEEDRGMMTAEDSKFFEISAAFEPFSNEGKDLIVQYQTKFEKNIECGGAYIKVGSKIKNQKKFGQSTPFNIMFGPDFCGSAKQSTQLMFKNGDLAYKKTKNIEYKQNPIGSSHLYRLVLKPDNSVRVEIDDQVVFEGSLKEDWEILPPKMITDVADRKPFDWVDDPKMDDPKAKKPSDWVDEMRIQDPSVTKPDEWDDDEDGEWVPQMQDNPAYKGEWVVERIANPEYKGTWQKRQIENPEFEDDDTLYRYDFGYVGFDLWQVRGGVIFDNIILCDDVADADAFKQKWKTLHDFEVKAKAADRESWKAKSAAEAKKLAETPIHYISAKDLKDKKNQETYKDAADAEDEDEL